MRAAYVGILLACSGTLAAVLLYGVPADIEFKRMVDMDLEYQRALNAVLQHLYPDAAFHLVWTSHESPGGVVLRPALQDRLETVLVRAGWCVEKTPFIGVADAVRWRIGDSCASTCFSSVP